MPAIRHTDPGPAARVCATCRTAHRPAIACPRPGRWLVSGAAAPAGGQATSNDVPLRRRRHDQEQ